MYVTDPVFNSSVQTLVSGVRFEVFTAVTMENGVFWDVTPCGSCKNRHFGGTWCFFAACVGCYLQLALFLVHRFLSP
jgi:hypothetical protein